MMEKLTTFVVALSVAGAVLYISNKVCSVFNFGSYLAGHIAFLVEFLATLAIVSSMYWTK